MYYYSVNETNNLTNVMKYVLWYAKEGIESGLRFDCFNCLGGSQDFVTELRFQPGDGLLNFYLFNYQLKEDLNYKEIGFCMV